MLQADAHHASPGGPHRVQAVGSNEFGEVHFVMPMMKVTFG